MKAIVSGASSGIGKAIALDLASKGWELAIISRNALSLKVLTEELNALNNSAKHIGFLGDLTKKSDSEAFFKQVQSFWKCPDLLVNCAGIYDLTSAVSLTETDIEQQLQQNFYSAFRFTSPWIPAFLDARAGTIVFIGSVLTKQVRSGASAYSLSKNMLDHYARLLADELRENNIKVCRIIPGSVNTPSWDGESVPLEEFVQPEDIVKSIELINNMASGAWMEEMVIRPLNKNW